MLQCCSERVEVSYSSPTPVTLQFEFIVVCGRKSGTLLRLYGFPWSTIDTIYKWDFVLIFNIVTVHVTITTRTYFWCLLHPQPVHFKWTHPKIMKVTPTCIYVEKGWIMKLFYAIELLVTCLCMDIWLYEESREEERRDRLYKITSYMKH